MNRTWAWMEWETEEEEHVIGGSFPPSSVPSESISRVKTLQLSKNHFEGMHFTEPSIMLDT